jgi:hypothetical protein
VGFSGAAVEDGVEAVDVVSVEVGAFAEVFGCNLSFQAPSVIAKIGMTFCENRCR